MRKSDTSSSEPGEQVLFGSVVLLELELLLDSGVAAHLAFLRMQALADRLYLRLRETLGENHREDDE